MGELSVAEVLDGAANVLVERGWTRGEWQDDETGCLCAEGAIKVAGEIEFFCDADTSPAGLFFERFLRSDIARWNDAPERTQAEVVQKLREAAQLARTQDNGSL